MIGTLVNKINEQENIKSFSFKINEEFSFVPGQYVYLTLPKLNYQDDRGNVRHFTISSSPTESQNITITTKIRNESGYKKTLDELEVGSKLDIRGPLGTFCIDLNNQNNIFLAGGIGITPFRSMIKYNIDKNLKIPMQLIYSNSDNNFLFKDDLDVWSKDNNYIKVNYHNSSETGHLDDKKITSLVTEVNNSKPTFWIVGPNGFVNAMEEVLNNMNVSEDGIRTEKFTGY